MTASGALNDALLERHPRMDRQMDGSPVGSNLAASNAQAIGIPEGGSCRPRPFVGVVPRRVWDGGCRQWLPVGISAARNSVQMRLACDHGEPCSGCAPMSDCTFDMPVDLACLVAEDFECLLGQSVRLHAADGTLDCVLDGVLRNPYPSGRVQGGFSLQLLGPLAPVFQQGQHQFDHPHRGPMVLFLTPVGRDAQGMRYEIIFN